MGKIHQNRLVQTSKALLSGLNEREITQEQSDCLFNALKLIFHLLFFCAHLRQTCTVLHVVIVVFSCACCLRSLFLHSVLDGLLLLVVLIQLSLEEATFPF